MYAETNCLREPNPYNTGPGSVQSIGPLSLQQAAGVTIPIDVAQVYVLEPLSIAAQTDSQLAAALQTFTHARAQQQSTCEDAYTEALDTTVSNGHVVVPQGDYGPLPTMLDHLLTLGTIGTLDR